MTSADVFPLEGGFLFTTQPTRRSITWMRMYPNRGLAFAILRRRNRNTDW